MDFCSIDLETRSVVDLRKTGVHRYAEDDSTDVLCMAYAFDNEPVQLWTRGLPFPARLRAHIREGGVLRAHNAQFERVMWRGVLVPKYHFPATTYDHWHCTAAESAAMGLPRALFKVAEVLRVAEQKDDTGHKLMLRMCKPRGFDDEGKPIWLEDAASLERLGAYCKQDVATERDVARRLRRLDEQERQVYILDQKINDRGIMLDRPLVLAAQKIVARGQREANTELAEITGGDIDAVTQTRRMPDWLQANGVDVDNVRKDTVRDLLAGEDVDGDVRRLLEIRQEVGKSSVGKIDTMLEVVCDDDILRGLLLYHGAHTGRWSGQKVQPQNFPRGGSVADPEQFIDDVLAGRFARLSESYHPVEIVSALLRGMLRAKPGHRFLSGDYSQIEARLVCWIAGATYEDNEYEKMAGVIFSRPWEEVLAEYKSGTGDGGFQRQIGKNSTLGCGFGMGDARFQEQVKEQTGLDISDELADRAVTAYRTRKHQVQQFWYDIDDTAQAAIRNPGRIFTCGRNDSLRWLTKGKFLWCVLPSGRPLAYALPRLEEQVVKKKDGGTFTKVGIAYSGIHNRRWVKRRTYGGALTENVVQAMARDIMTSNMLQVEEAGYPVVLTVHDEVVADVPDGHGSLDEYLSLLETCPAWATGAPIAVEGWEGPRYKKD